ncbi:MAG: hypothetical protein J7L61_01620, partial [Thermoplasmata archaeon]|nr:hypothetical protein [Thermoplasmata archaeon]
MNSGVIFLLTDKGLIPLKEEKFKSEDKFQEWLASHPELIPGDQISRDTPRKWLLIGREIGVPDSEEGKSRWSLDHLFLDQDGIPTFVEVKRSEDTRLRREVVSQMLDYAANATLYLDIELIKIKFREMCEKEGIPAEAKLQEIFGERFSERYTLDEYWEKVKTNLETGKIRMLFVADSIPHELQRIIEFLNEQMSPAEVLAVEIKKYSGQGQTTLVPRVIGFTSRALDKKGLAQKRSEQYPGRHDDILEFFGDYHTK